VVAVSRSPATVAACLVAGCLATPAYEPAVAVSYREAGTGGAVTGPGFALQFAGGDGFHLPDALLIDGTNVLGRELGAGCDAEGGLGFLISPTPRISAQGGATPITNRLTPGLRGPAVVQVTLAWATRMACNSARAPGGTATFTVFPDGRIVRHDTLVDASASPISAATCACAGAASLQFTVSTFWTLARDQFRALYAPDRSPLPTTADPVIANYATSCIDAGSYQLAFAWPDPNGTTIRGGDTLIGFGRDLVFGTSRLDDFSWDNTSTLVIGRSGCAAANALAQEHAAPSPLMIAGTPRRPARHDGIYGGDPGDGQPGIAVTTERVEVTGAVNSSFAVWLRFPRSVGGVRATREGATGPWYLPQQVDDRSWIIWFRDSMSAAQQIVIEPR
jgi:hypothetical protein